MGKSQNSINLPSDTQLITSLQVSKSVIYIFTGEQVNNTLLYSTNDFGTTWKVISIPDFSPSSSPWGDLADNIYVSKENYVYICTTGGIYLTKDRGDNWDKLDSQASSLSLLLKDNKDLLVSIPADNSNNISITKKSLINWQTIELPKTPLVNGGSYEVLDVIFDDSENKVYAISKTGSAGVINYFQYQIKENSNTINISEIITTNSSEEFDVGYGLEQARYNIVDGFKLFDMNIGYLKTGSDLDTGKGDIFKWFTITSNNKLLKRGESLTPKDDNTPRWESIAMLKIFTFDTINTLCLDSVGVFSLSNDLNTWSVISIPENI